MPTKQVVKQHVTRLAHQLNGRLQPQAIYHNILENTNNRYNAKGAYHSLRLARSDYDAVVRGGCGDIRKVLRNDRAHPSLSLLWTVNVRLRQGPVRAGPDECAGAPGLA